MSQYGKHLKHKQGGKGSNRKGRPPVVKKAIEELATSLIGRVRDGSLFPEDAVMSEKIQEVLTKAGGMGMPADGVVLLLSMHGAAAEGFSFADWIRFAAGELPVEPDSLWTRVQEITTAGLFPEFATADAPRRGLELIRQLSHSTRKDPTRKSLEALAAAESEGLPRSTAILAVSMADAAAARTSFLEWLQRWTARSRREAESFLPEIDKIRKAGLFPWHGAEPGGTSTR